VTGGELVTHLWVEEKTWFPVLEEQYDVQGNLVAKKEVSDLVINSGLSEEGNHWLGREEFGRISKTSRSLIAVATLALLWFMYFWNLL